MFFLNTVFMVLDVVRMVLGLNVSHITYYEQCVKQMCIKNILPAFFQFAFMLIWAPEQLTTFRSI